MVTRYGMIADESVSYMIGISVCVQLEGEADSQAAGYFELRVQMI